MHEAVVEYLRDVRRTAALATYTRKRHMAEAFAAWCAQRGKDLVAATRADVEQYLRCRTWSAETRRMHWHTVRELYQVLGYAQNPAEGIVLRRHPRPLPRVAPKAALEAALAGPPVSDTVQALRDRLMAELAYGSGLRRGELARLDIEDLDLERRTAYVHGKGDRTRIVPLTTAALALVRAYLEKRRATRGPLFVATRTGRRLSLAMLGLVFRKRFHTHAHALRHACASHMLANGCSLRHIQELLGHRLLCTTQRYTHITPGDLADVIARRHPRASSDPEKAA